MSETNRTVVIAGKRFALGSAKVEGGLRGVLPEPLKDHFVVINRRRYPPKQVVEVMTGLDRAEFTTHHARRILTGLGFPAGRRNAAENQGGHADRTRTSSAKRTAVSRRARDRVPITVRPSAETLEPFVGQWVATKGSEVLVAAPDAKTVVGWLAEHGKRADSMFRVPADRFEASGLAPL